MSSSDSDPSYSPRNMKKESVIDDDYYDEAEIIYVKCEKDDDGLKGSKNKKYLCETCLKTFKTPKELKIHTRVHTNERPYKCTQCDKAFKQQGALNDHMNTHTGERKHECQVCEGKFSTSSSLKRHVRKIHGKQKSFSCSLCSHVFLNKTAFVEHKETHYTTILNSSSTRIQQQADLEGYKCTICNKSFKRSVKLFHHLDVHSNKLFTCVFCGKSFTHLAYQTHIKRHHIPRLCSICNEEFHDKKLYYIHERKHFRVATDICDYCKKIFGNTNDLKEHMIMEHCNNEQVPCQVCCKVYDSKEHLNKHVTFAHVSCGVCKKYFNFYAEMMLHFGNTHNIFKCSRCRSIFKSKSHLAFHLNTVHLIIGKFTCKLCGKQFQRYRLLQAHKETHNLAGGSEKNNANLTVAKKEENDIMNVKKNVVDTVDRIKVKKENSDYKSERKVSPKEARKSGSSVRRCQFCVKAFWAAPNLYRHTLKSHGRYPCMKCNKTFFILQELEQHKTVHLKDSSTASTCEICNLILSTPSCLRRHILTVHMKIPADGTSSRPSKDHLIDTLKKLDSNKSEKSGITKYQCDYCEEEMAKKISLLIHQYRAHKDEIPPSTFERVARNMYPCATCGKEFYGKYNFEKHVAIHDRGLLTCEWCGTEFKAKSGLITHLKVKHRVDYKKKDNKRKESGKNESWKCDWCDTSFKAKSGLTVHLKLRHSVEYIEGDYEIIKDEVEDKE